MGGFEPRSPGASFTIEGGEGDERPRVAPWATEATRLGARKKFYHKVWGWLDSNQRIPKESDLQSDAIGRYATPPKYAGERT